MRQIDGLSLSDPTPFVQFLLSEGYSRSLITQHYQYHLREPDGESVLRVIRYYHSTDRATENYYFNGWNLVRERIPNVPKNQQAELRKECNRLESLFEAQYKQHHYGTYCMPRELHYIFTGKP